MTRTPVTIRDPIVEPLWSGTRVLAHVDTRAVQPQPGVQLIASMGIDIGFDEPELVTALGDAVLAQDAVLDGIITDEATRDAAGAAIVAEARMSMMGTLMSRDVGIEVRRPAAIDETATPRAFVAVDLLRLDGQSLLDVPLLERKRLLGERPGPGPAGPGVGDLPTTGQWLGGLVAGRRVARRHAEGGQWALHPG